MPACKIIAGKMLGQDVVRETENVPLSKITTIRNTDDMPHDSQEVLCDKTGK
jgi:hypothetical protein